MAEQLHWQTENGQLSLYGELEQETLLPLWQQHQQLMKQVDIIDVSGLDRVDSGGLALLVHLQQAGLQQGKVPRFTGITDKLRTLIVLYNLQNIIADQC